MANVTTDNAVEVMKEPKKAKQAIEYKTLDLRIRKQGRDVLIEAIGPEGEWAESHTKMPDEEFLQNIVKRLREFDKEIKLDQLGEKLGEALMPSPILQLYTTILQRILARPNQGLRLRLHFLGSAKKYERLPWEAIRINGSSIVNDPCQAIVRTVDLSEPAIPLAVKKPPYRILVVGEFKEETKRVKEALKSLIDSGLIHIDIIESPKMTQIESILRQGDFHIFHYGGVGGSGFLKIADDVVDATGNTYVDGHRLGVLLHGSGLLMAFMNTSDTAYAIEKSQAGMAEALLQAGLPIVIAIGYVENTDPGYAFAGAFYNELVQTGSLEQAMFVGRRAISELPYISPTDWVNPVLFTRTLDEKFWTGEAGYIIQTYIHEGQLVTEVSKPGTFDSKAFANRLQVARDFLKKIQSPSGQLEAQHLIGEAEDCIANSDMQNAAKKLREASTNMILAVSNQEKQQKDEKRESNARWTVLGVSLGLLLTVAVLGYALREIWTPSMSIPVIALPVSVIVWSCIGGVAAMLQTFVGTKSGEETSVKQVNYEWLLWRPILGVIMGSVVYLSIAAGLVVLGVGDTSTLANTRNTYFLWALAFLGGFSDKFAILVFDNIVRTFSKPQEKPASDKSQESEKDSS